MLLPPYARATAMALCALVLSPPLHALAQSRCPSPALAQALERCDGIGPAPRGTSESPRTHLPPARAPETSPSETSAPATPLTLREFPRPPSSALRSASLLDREIETLERIVGRLDPSDPRGADYLFRLAETHAERARSLEAEARSRDEPIFEAERDRDTARAATLRREQSEAEAAVVGAREGAIRAYARLVREHPDFARADEVLAALAATLEDMGQSERALEIHRRLVREHPGSRFVPQAWLAFGEHAFAAGDMETAGQLYERVLETPPDQNRLYGFALYRLAWTHYNTEDFAGALTQLTRVLDFAREHPDAPDAAALARQAQAELVLPYARVGRPPQALAFFRRLAPSDAAALEMLERLGELYVDTGQWAEAVTTYRALMAEAPSADHLCRWQAQITGAVIASRPKPEQVTEIERLVDIEGVFVSASHPAADLLACRVAAAEAVYETAVAWHREAVGTDDQPGTRDARTMALAERLYVLAIEALPDLDTLELPSMAREDWPTRGRVAYARAELSFARDDWRACGPAFDRVLELTTEPSLAADAAYGAAFCYDRLFQLEHADTEAERLEATASMEPRAPSELESRMLAAFQRFACVAPASEDLAQVQYRRARVYYEARRFEEAAVLFRAIAFDHADHELAEPAANLYLDSLNGLFRRDGRLDCLDRMTTDLEPLAESFCASETLRDAHPDLCTVVSQVRCGLLRREAESLGATGHHREAAAAYVAMFRDHRECGRLDEVLYDAAIHYEAARLLGRAIRVRHVLLDRFPESPLARVTLHDLGANYHALALYAQAADHYEQYAHRYPDDTDCVHPRGTESACPSAPAALETAVFFRLGLGEPDHALEDARLYERNYRRSRPRETADVVFSLGSIHERRGDWARAGAHYRAFLRDYGRSARPDQLLRAHVQEGRAEWEQGRHDRAVPHFRAAEERWSRLGPDALASEEGADLMRARAAEAASEALFYLGEERFEAFRAVRFPRYRGPSTLAAVNRWSREELAPWLARKIATLHEAEAAYLRVEPLGIPEWRIAAAERVGEMYRDIIEDVRSAPIPDDIASDDVLLDLYEGVREALLNGSSPGPDGAWETADDVACPDATAVELSSSGPEDDGALPPSCRVAPIARAMSSFEHCLSLATTVRWFNEWSTRCESELHDLNPRRYPLAAELRATAAFAQDALATPGPAEARPTSEDEVPPEPEAATREAPATPASRADEPGAS
ncbi:MAG: tetratricopeptide repeat protein [Sandaracinaceae bacterium]|nr:tetratricopeptide repeat protein [Sandaracinaceae bacterium]